MFHVGQLVLHRRDKSPSAGRFLPWCEGANMPVEGHVYTVRKVAQFGRVVGLWFSELDNSSVSYITRSGEEPGFNSRHFVPLRDEALSVFRQALEPSPKQTETA